MRTYYFTLREGTVRDRSVSSKALEKAFDRLDEYFKNLPCNAIPQVEIGVLAIKLDEFIKDEFKKLGGQASPTAPQGYKGEIQSYETNYGLTKPDC